MIRTRSRRLEPVGQRVRRLLRRLGGGADKRQTAHLVEIGDARLKRVRFAHLEQAVAAERVLQALRGRGVAPAPVARYAHELWLEYVPGTPLRRGGPAPVAELGRVFATLYAGSRRADPALGEALAAEVERSAALLHTAGLVDRATRDRVAARALETLPPALALGTDYLDARPGNFVASEGRLRIVDVESLVQDEPIGTGAARAWLRWPGVSREALLDAIAAAGGPDLRPAADFLALRFGVRWTLRCLLQGKQRQLDPDWLARALG